MNSPGDTCTRILGDQLFDEPFTKVKASINNKKSLQLTVRGKSGKNENIKTKTRMLELIEIIRKLGPTPKRILSHETNTNTRPIYKEQGRVFQSNPYLFTKRAQIYIVGLNPNLFQYGNAMNAMKMNFEKKNVNYRHKNMVSTIEKHTMRLLKSDPAFIRTYSPYIHERMGTKETSLQQSFKMFFDDLKDMGITSTNTPISNIVFIRTNSENALKQQFNQNGINDIIDSCWKFHSKALSFIQPKIILTFSSMARDTIQKKLGGVWNSVYESSFKTSGQILRYSVVMRQGTNIRSPGSCDIIFYVTHPSRVSWTDTTIPTPSSIVRKLLKGTLPNGNTSPRSVIRMGNTSNTNTNNNNRNLSIPMNIQKPQKVNVTTERQNKQTRKRNRNNSSSSQATNNNYNNTTQSLKKIRVKRSPGKRNATRYNVRQF